MIEFLTGVAIAHLATGGCAIIAGAVVTVLVLAAAVFDPDAVTFLRIMWPPLLVVGFLWGPILVAIVLLAPYGLVRAVRAR